MKKLSEIEITEEMREKVSKCATAEELTALAQEYDVELTQEEIAKILKENCLKELTDEDLDQVAGGDGGDDKAKHLPADHGPRIGKYEAEHYKGRTMYCVNDKDPTQYFQGQLYWSDEFPLDTFWGRQTKRVHSFYVYETGPYGAGMEVMSATRKAQETRTAHNGDKFDDVMGDYCTLFLEKK